MELGNAAMLGGQLPSFKLCMQVGVIVAMVACTLVQAQAPAPVAAPPPTMVLAPPPAPPYVNVTQVLEQAGDYSTFVSLMVETKVDEIFQRNANQTQTGITIFAPSNEAFRTKLATTLMSNLTELQKTSLVLYHALTTWVPLSSLQLAQDNQTATLATYNNGGGQYLLNLTNIFGTVQIISGWTTANLTSTLYSFNPVSIFAINQVLLPDDIFGLPSPAPAPAPSSGAPTPTPSTSSPSSSALGPSGSNGSPNFSPAPITSSFAPLFVCILYLMLFSNYMHL